MNCWIYFQSAKADVAKKVAFVEENLSAKYYNCGEGYLAKYVTGTKQECTSNGSPINQEPDL